jgi:hypothetical protein
MLLLASMGSKANEGEQAIRHFQSLASPDTSDVYEMARLGRAGYDAGPAVLRLLNEEDRELRSAAVLTLGVIHYVPAETRLIEVLSDPIDPLLTSKAAQALGRLGDSRALEALRHVSATHWRSRVRVDATQAIRHIRDRSPYPPMGLGDVMDLDALGDSVTECMADPYRYMRDQPNRVTLEVPGGQLVGTDHGEFGGDLRFDASSGAIEPLLQKNVLQVMTLGKRTIALTGLLHMGTAEGAIYEVSRDTAAHWRATLWRGLDGPPLWAAKDRAGDLHIGLPTYTLRVSSDGTMEELGCETPAAAAATLGRDN